MIILMKEAVSLQEEHLGNEGQNRQREGGRDKK